MFQFGPVLNFVVWLWQMSSSKIIFQYDTDIKFSFPLGYITQDQINLCFMFLVYMYVFERVRYIAWNGENTGYQQKNIFLRILF